MIAVRGVINWPCLKRMITWIIALRKWRNKHLYTTVKNPLADPVSWKSKFYRRVKLFPWWLRYNLGIAEESILKDKIIELAESIGLEHKWIERILRHAVSEFSKKGLGSDYYGYHNIDHELQAAYFTLLAANNVVRAEELQYQSQANVTNNTITISNKFSQEDMRYLFVAALFHDYDPLKQFDKPHEDSVEWFLRNDD